MHVDDAVCVDVERDLDLRHSARGGCDAAKFERAQELVVAGKLAFTLVDLDHHRRLVVIRGREDLGGLGRDGSVALDELRHHAALGLYAEAQGGDVDEQHVLALATDDARLERGAHGHHLIGVDALVGLLAAGELLDDVGHCGHTGRAAHHDNVVDVGELDARILDHLVERRLGALEQILCHLLELGTRELGVQVDRTVLADAQVLQGDGGLLSGTEFLLGLLGGLAQTLDGRLVLGQVDALGVLYFLDQEVDNALVPVVAAEAIVASGGAHLNGREVVLVLAHFEQRDVERSATEVEDKNELVFLALVEAVSERGGRGLVDDAQHVEARDLACVLSSLALGVVEVRGNGDHGIGHLLTQVFLGVALELAQDAR